MTSSWVRKTDIYLGKEGEKPPQVRRAKAKAKNAYAMSCKCSIVLGCNPESRFVLLDYFLFVPTKESRGGERFENNEDDENCVCNWLTTLPQIYFKERMFKLPNH